MAAKTVTKEKPVSIYFRELSNRFERLRLSYSCRPSKAALVRRLLEIGLDQLEKEKR